MTQLVVAIVDYGMGNLFSVEGACATVGMKPMITDKKLEIESADLVIIPGVGAFPDAMSNLTNSGLAKTLCQIAGRGQPIVGICLGMQLLFSRSDEFENASGLGVVPGVVRNLSHLREQSDVTPKIPNTGWVPITKKGKIPLFEGLSGSEPMYFVHSHYVEPENDKISTCTAQFAGMPYCAGFQDRNVIGFQFHPEKSGSVGLRLYANIRDWALKVSF